MMVQRKPSSHSSFTTSSSSSRTLDSPTEQLGFDRSRFIVPSPRDQQVFSQPTRADSPIQPIDSDSPLKYLNSDSSYSAAQVLGASAKAEEAGARRNARSGTRPRPLPQPGVVLNRVHSNGTTESGKTMDTLPVYRSREPSFDIPRPLPEIVITSHSSNRSLPAYLANGTRS
ncbi:hypothetical protein VKT23_009782 [Stygiomarasmius scandens]|uniref:Uncharacterized protein n=1 Tax=Marasmiellus scandens TaxID=2682957 RepID=A0ABR1JGN3_9AGAR